MNTYINTSSTSNTTALPTGDYLMVDLSVKNARIPPQVKSIIERYALTTTAGSLCRATLQAEFTGNYIMLDITTNDDAWGKIKERVRRFRKDNNIKIPVAVPVPEALFKDPNEPPLDYNRDEERGSSEEDDIALGKRIRFMRNPQDKFPIKLPRCASMLDPFAYDGLTSFVGRHFAEDEYRPELFFEMKNGKVHPLKDAGKKRDRKRSLKKKARVGAHSDMEVEPHKPTFKWNHQNAAVVFTQQYKFVERHSARQAKDIRDHVLQAGDWCEDQKILM